MTSHEMPVAPSRTPRRVPFTDARRIAPARTLVAPISAANLAAAHLLRHPITADELARVLGVSDKSLRAVEEAR